MAVDYQTFLSRDWRTYSSVDESHHLMSRYTGAAIGEYEALVQRLAALLGTPKGSVPWNREYGSDLPRLVDRPMNSLFYIEAYGATAEAIQRWEPLFELTKTTIGEFEESVASIFLEGNSKIDGQVLTIGELVIDLKGSPVVTLRDSS